jgi:RimJ/RimL family protein N-acetyltransferase
MAKATAASIFADYSVTDIVVTVQQANVGSWRILEKVGFQRRWEGELDSPDPSDQGPEYLYALRRH